MPDPSDSPNPAGRRPLRLFVEAFGAGNDSGLGRMTRLFARWLAREDSPFEVRVALPHGLDLDIPAEKRLHMPTRPYRAVVEAGMPWPLFRFRPDWLVCLGRAWPRLRPACKTALLIPDAGPVEPSPLRMSRHQVSNRRWLESRAHRADRILTLSPFTRDRLIALAGLPPQRIRVVFPVDPEEGDAGAPGGLAGTPAPHPRPYAVTVGNVEPRKNHPGLLRAYRLYLDKNPRGLDLVCLGHQAWGWGEAMRLREELGLGERVHFTGHVSEAAKTEFLRQARFFVAPSLYEGFGYPLYEAMVLGKACIYHRGSSHEAFAKGHALAADCSDPHSLAEAIEKLAADPDLRRSLEASALEGVLAFGRRCGPHFLDAVFSEGA